MAGQAAEHLVVHIPEAPTRLPSSVTSLIAPSQNQLQPCNASIAHNSLDQASPVTALNGPRTLPAQPSPYYRPVHPPACHTQQHSFQHPRSLKRSSPLDQGLFQSLLYSRPTTSRPRTSFDVNLRRTSSPLPSRSSPPRYRPYPQSHVYAQDQNEKVNTPRVITQQHHGAPRPSEARRNVSQPALQVAGQTRSTSQPHHSTAMSTNAQLPPDAPLSTAGKDAHTPVMDNLAGAPELAQEPVQTKQAEAASAAPIFDSEVAGARSNERSLESEQVRSKDAVRQKQLEEMQKVANLVRLELSTAQNAVRRSAEGRVKDAVEMEALRARVIALEGTNRKLHEDNTTLSHRLEDMTMAAKQSQAECLRAAMASQVQQMTIEQLRRELATVRQANEQVKILLRSATKMECRASFRPPEMTQRGGQLGQQTASSKGVLRPVPASFSQSNIDDSDDSESDSEVETPLALAITRKRHGNTTDRRPQQRRNVIMSDSDEDDVPLSLSISRKLVEATRDSTALQQVPTPVERPDLIDNEDLLDELMYPDEESFSSKVEQLQDPKPLDVGGHDDTFIF